MLETIAWQSPARRRENVAGRPRNSMREQLSDTESKELIGGYFYLRVANLEEAVEIARQCPGLDFGCEVEIRPVAERCMDRLRAPAEHGDYADDATVAALR